jgi:hypothetical protein
VAVEVLSTVEDLAHAGSNGFRASYVASQMQAESAEVRAALIQLVQSGELDLKFDLICPDNGRTIRRYSSEEELPIGKMESDTKCESDDPFRVEKHHIWVTFAPSLEFVQRVNRTRANQDKKKLTAPLGLADGADELVKYERDKLISQTQGGQNFYDCNITMQDHRAQVVATDGAAAAASQGAAATSGGQAVSGSGSAAKDQATAVGTSTFSLPGAIKQSKLSMAAGSFGVIATVAATILLVAGEVDLGLAGYVLAAVSVLLAAVPLVQKNG